MLRLPGSKQGSVGALRLMVACLICYSAGQQQCPSRARGDEAGGSVQATDAKLRASCSSVDEAGGVQATDAKLRASCSR
ncbi:hypothetical protein PR002_g14295 [Phytophthora rubi]|uniref:RxLR effector protein n=1 Tax=Phytophthora rubi TaxID=129364 RepID=A0A6A3L5T3_9STRA|nr:hypothetical protein PR002_g14295 [Phytophthora rubi]